VEVLTSNELEGHGDALFAIAAVVGHVVGA
jgi:hypothetical protein